MGVSRSFVCLDVRNWILGAGVRNRALGIRAGLLEREIRAGRGFGVRF